MNRRARELFRIGLCMMLPFGLSLGCRSNANYNSRGSQGPAGAPTTSDRENVSGRDDNDRGGSPSGSSWGRQGYNTGSSAGNPSMNVPLEGSTDRQPVSGRDTLEDAARGTGSGSSNMPGSGSSSHQ